MIFSNKIESLLQVKNIFLYGVLFLCLSSCSHKVNDYVRIVHSDKLPNPNDMIVFFRLEVSQDDSLYSIIVNHSKRKKSKIIVFSTTDTVMVDSLRPIATFSIRSRRNFAFFDLHGLKAGKSYHLIVTPTKRSIIQ